MKSGFSLFIPYDPYGIYKKLAEVFFEDTVVGSKRIGEKSILDGDIWVLAGCQIAWTGRLWFLKWVYQEIPEAFWERLCSVCHANKHKNWEKRWGSI
jgi:hypothetical protein